MKFLTLIGAITTVLPVITAGPAPSITIEEVEGPKTGLHIVTLEKDVAKADILGQISGIRGFDTGSGVTHEWSNALNGFAGNFDKETLEALLTLPGVVSIVEDGFVNTTATQTNAPWGLARINSKSRIVGPENLLNYQYKYDDRAGQGVDIYIIDTGIRTTHTDFGGRARWAGSFGANQPLDGSGHGTHCAGTAVGSRYGVAKKANVYAVKVLPDSGSGPTTDVISGIDHVLGLALSSGRPSVASMSFRSRAHSPLDTAARNLVLHGVHVVAAAGNDNDDANNYSPARVPEVITVGSSTILDQRAGDSNYGPMVDVFAPGENIISAWKDSDTSAAMISGTSMATPHVAGLVAYIISTQGDVAPAVMTQRIKNMALKNALNPATLPAGTANTLANNQFQL